MKAMNMTGALPPSTPLRVLSAMLFFPASGTATGDTIAAEDVKKMFGNANIYKDFVNQIANAKSGG